MYVISSPESLYFATFVNVWLQSASVVLFPLTTASIGVAPPFNMYLIELGLLPATFELSFHSFVTAIVSLSSGTLNVLITLNPLSLLPVITFVYKCAFSVISSSTLYWYSCPFESYFAKFSNVYDQFSSVVLFPLTTFSIGVAPPFKMYLIELGLLPFALLLSIHVLVAFTFTLSSGTLNVFVTLKPFTSFE